MKIWVFVLVIACVARAAPYLPTLTVSCAEQLTYEGGAIVLVAPTGTGARVPSVARSMLPESTELILVAPDGRVSEEARALPRTRVMALPPHRPDLPQDQSLAQGLKELMPLLRDHSPRNVVIASEKGVDWGMALRKTLGLRGSSLALAPQEFVSKSAIRRRCEEAGIADVLWPLQFAGVDAGFKEFAAKNPDAILHAKLDNSSGMNGRRMGPARRIPALVEELYREGNKHGRAAKVIIEQSIDDVPYSKGVAWVEAAFDGVAYRDEGGEIRIKDTLAFRYRKTEQKMYISDGLFDPTHRDYRIARKVINAIARAVGYEEGGIHFELFLRVDVNGRVIPDAPVIPVDMNFRLGGNNKFSERLTEMGAFSVNPEEMLLLSSLDPAQLPGIRMQVVADSVRILTLSFSGAPRRAIFSRDPMGLLSQLRALKTWTTDTIPWTSGNYRDRVVGEGTELDHTFEVVLFGHGLDLERDEAEALRLEREMAKLMVARE